MHPREPERLQDVRGVDRQTAVHLRMAGYTSVDDLARATCPEIQQVRTIDREQAAVIHRALAEYDPGGGRRGGTTRRTALRAAAGAVVLAGGGTVGMSAVETLRDELAGRSGESTTGPTETTGGADSAGPPETPEDTRADIDDGPANRRLDTLDSLRIPFEIVREGDGRDVTEQVVGAMAYWEEHAPAYAPGDGFRVRYESAEDEAPYLTVTLVDEVRGCGGADDLNGCADIPQERMPDHLDATVRRTLTDQGVFETAVHELGHTLGLGHDDDPQYYMQPQLPTVVGRETVSVVLPDRVPAADIPAALDWVAAEVDGAPRTFEQVNEESAAGIVVQTAPDACERGFVACTRQSDRYADQVIVRLDRELATATYDWHTAALLAELSGDVPDILSADTPRATRESDWWAET